ncbi:MAG TPA: M20/M25/M40 family metallo-hydrolase [Candidatus Blautia avistercoris]|nr:M20/M25/M40 family metallo-hydrolase [Candidatus Blautia avistercoris]
MYEKYADAFHWLESQKENMITTLKNFVQTPSCGREPEDVISFSEMFLEFLEKEGFSCRYIPVGNENGGTISAIYGEEREGKPILFSGHYDTALYRQITDKENPWKREDGKLYGSGVLDMKGGIVIAIYCARALKQIGWDKRPLKMIWSGDEEVNHKGSNGGEIFRREALGCEYAFHMETGFPEKELCIGRKGGVRCKIQVEGIDAHAGKDFEKGRNAIVEMAYKILEIKNLTNMDRGTTLNVGTIQGGTIFNSVPAHCEIIVDMRFTSNQELADTKEKLEAILKKTYVEGTTTHWEYIDSMPVFETTPEGLKLFRFLQKTAENAGLPVPESIYSGGSSDAAATAMAGVPTVCACGTIGEWNHTTKEYIWEDSLVERAKFFTAAILDIFQ